MPAIAIWNFIIKHGNNTYNLRIQTQPALHAKHLVIRLLKHTGRALISPKVASFYRRLLILSQLSDRVITIPELSGEQGVRYAQKGFNIITTANSVDEGLHKMSAIYCTILIAKSVTKPVAIGSNCIGTAN